MKEQIKDVCFFIIIGQTLLYFQSGKKYEKICRMILDLLILVGIVGIVLNLLQSIGIQNGELTAEGGAVSNMQHSMEEALSKQLDIGIDKTDFLQGVSAEDLMEQYTLEEIKSRYNYLALEYGMEIEKIERSGENLTVYVRRNGGTAETEETEGTEDKPELFEEEYSGNVNDDKDKNKNKDKNKDIENSVRQVEILDIYVEEIQTEEKNRGGEGGKAGEENRTKEEGKAGEESKDGEGEGGMAREGDKDEEEDRTEEGETEEGTGRMSEQAALEMFRTELANVFLMEKDRLEVILIG